MFDERIDGWIAKSSSVTCNTWMKTGFLELRLHRSVSPGGFTRTNSFPQTNQSGKLAKPMYPVSVVTNAGGAVEDLFI